MCRHSQSYRLILVTLLLPAILASDGCAVGRNTNNATSIVDFLYPHTARSVVTPGMPDLPLPFRVGIAFVPGGGSYSNYNIFALPENRKIELMQQVAGHFKGYSFVKGINIIPSAYLKAKGSFANLEQIRTMYGIEVVALISYDQAQVTDKGSLSLSYWTIDGAYVVPEEKNDTHTMIDVVVMDIESRSMLFHAPGLHHIKGGATSINQGEQLKLDSDAGFAGASKDMIANLDQQLALFKDKISAAKQR